jgi:hypothetical protein
MIREADVSLFEAVLCLVKTTCLGRLLSAKGCSIRSEESTGRAATSGRASLSCEEGLRENEIPETGERTSPHGITDHFGPCGNRPIVEETDRFCQGIFETIFKFTMHRIYNEKA